MSGVSCLALAGLVVAFGVPTALMAACGLALLAAQVLVYWAQGAFAGSAAGWAAVYAARYRRTRQDGGGL